MKLKVIGSGSKGNCYLLYNNSEGLILEAGVPFKEVLRATKGKTSHLKACLITHEHGDHTNHLKEVLDHGIAAYMTAGTAETLPARCHSQVQQPTVFDYNLKNEEERSQLTPWSMFAIGNFMILPFKTVHDAKEPCGYYIYHPEMGFMLFATDTAFIPNTFAKLSHILIECNYDDRLLTAREDIPESLKKRIRESHQSIDTCIEALLANDMSITRNVMLIHVSEGDGDKTDFWIRAKKALPEDIELRVATPGVTIDMNKTPF